MALYKSLSAELLQVIGRIVVYHAVLEHALDMMVYTIYSRVPGADAYSTHHPHNLKAEIEFLNNCFTNLPDLASVSDEGLRLVAQIEAVGNGRHAIAHGYLHGWDTEKKGTNVCAHR